MLLRSRVLPISLVVMLGLAVAGPALGASSVLIEDDFDTDPQDWDPHIVSTTTERIPMTVDPEAVMGPNVTGSGGGGASGDFLFVLADYAADESCTATGCGSQCLNPLWGTTRWGLVHPQTYDPATEGTVEAIDVTFSAKTWPRQFTEFHGINQHMVVLIRQGDGSGGFRLFASQDQIQVPWNATHPATGTWYTLSYELDPGDPFWEWETVGSTSTSTTVQLDFDEPFEIGVAFARTATWGTHPTCGTGDQHSWVMTNNVGIDEFSAEIHAVDSDDDGIPDNLDLPCDNGADDDGDGYIDHPADTGCFTTAWAAEDPPCSDGIDNDGHGDVDYPADPGCAGPAGLTENPQCQDGIDNDGDGYIDAADPECSGGTTNNHEGAPCGLLGIEVLPVLGWAALAGRGRARRRLA